MAVAGLGAGDTGLGVSNSPMAELRSRRQALLAHLDALRGGASTVMVLLERPTVSICLSEDSLMPLMASLQSDLRKVEEALLAAEEAL